MREKHNSSLSHSNLGLNYRANVKETPLGFKSMQTNKITAVIKERKKYISGKLC